MFSAQAVHQVGDLSLYLQELYEDILVVFFFFLNRLRFAVCTALGDAAAGTQRQDPAPRIWAMTPQGEGTRM